MSAIRI